MNGTGTVIFRVKYDGVKWDTVNAIFPRRVKRSWDRLNSRAFSVLKKTVLDASKISAIP